MPNPYTDRSDAEIASHIADVFAEALTQGLEGGPDDVMSCVVEGGLDEYARQHAPDRQNGGIIHIGHEVITVSDVIAEHRAISRGEAAGEDEKARATRNLAEMQIGAAREASQRLDIDPLTYPEG